MLVRGDVPGIIEHPLQFKLTNLRPDMQTRDPSVLSYAIGIESEGIEPKYILPNGS
jgi:hypothetical protein